MSDAKGPSTFIPFFFNLLIAGIIILRSSDFFLSSLLCGFKPNIAIVGFLEFFCKKYLGF